MDAVTAIKNDHRLLEGLFDRLASGRGDRRSLLVEVAARLAAHSHAEEMKVYPALAQAQSGERREVEHGAQEHHEAEQKLHRLMAMEPDDSAFETELADFVEAVLHHVQEEETKLLPALQQAVDAGTLDRLGQAFEEVRGAELEIAGLPPEPKADGGDASSQGSSGGGRRGRRAEPELDQLSREELYERAKEAGVPGRSHMTKEELAQALRHKK